MKRHWEGARKATTDQDAYLNSVALNLHGFYSGLERVFELIPADVDGARLGEEHWHAELLRQMTLDLPNVRPPVLRPETVQSLADYRKFRHLIRNIYSTNIIPSELEKLVAKLPELWIELKRDLDVFYDFLIQISSADEPKE